MARPLRINREGGWYHAFARGLNRMALFLDDRDREHFVELLTSLPERFGVEIHAYVLMENHFHLILRTPEGNLSRTMQWLNLSYAAWFNVRHQRTGPVFQRPFGSVPVQNGEWVYELSLYVHLNPLRIRDLGLSKQDRKRGNLGARAAPSREEVRRRMRRLREYPWSSYRVYAGYVSAPEWLCNGEIMRRAAREPAARCKAYRLATQLRAAEGGDPGKLEALRERVAVGTAGFVKQLKQIGEQVGLFRETAAMRELRRRVSVEEVKQAVAAVREEDWNAMVARHGDQGKYLAMWVARRCTGATLREIGEAMGGRDYAAVGMAIRRFEARLSTSKELMRQAAKIGELLHVKMAPQ